MSSLAGGVFDAPRAAFESPVELLEGADARGLEHGELEDRLQVDGRELICLLLQSDLDLRAQGERRAGDVCDVEGVRHGRVEAGHERPLGTVFGKVTVRRIAYRAVGAGNLHPADAVLNLPAERQSHGIRRLAAIESSRGSFDDAVAAVGRATGQALGTRQAEELAARAAVDFEAFYAQRAPAEADDDAVLALSCDGKGIVMRPDALRAQTAKAAAAGQTKLKTRLSKGEKPNRKRIAEVGAVYDVTPAPRTAADVIALTDSQRDGRQEAPAASGKWLTASIAEDAAVVVGQP